MEFHIKMGQRSWISAIQMMKKQKQISRCSRTLSSQKQTMTWTKTMKSTKAQRESSSYQRQQMQMLTLFIHKEFKNSLHLRSNSNCCNQSNCHLSALLMIHRYRTSRLTTTTNSYTSYKTNWSQQTISFSKLAKIIFLPTTIGAQIKFRPSLKTISMKPNSMRRAQNISSGNL